MSSRPQPSPKTARDKPPQPPTPQELAAELSRLFAAQAKAMTNAIALPFTNGQLAEFHRRQNRIRQIMKRLGVYRPAT